MKFLDEAKIYLKGGNGGDGVAAFRREKFIEFGGPSGGDGGRGGSIYFRALGNLNTLIDYRYQQHFKAKKGQNGMGRDRYGRAADDIILHVPIGTQIYAEDKETLLADLNKSDMEFCAARGGRGGLGNLHFKSSTNRAPRQCTPGKLGEERWVWLVLKLIADVGLIGLPNAGKSTLLSVLSAARPKIADYPFTTLIPALGVVNGRALGLADSAANDFSFVMADLPGLIEGAAEGVGLGTRFLAHAERTRAVLHLISMEPDASDEDLTDDSKAQAKNIVGRLANHYAIIRREIKNYGAGIEHKPELVVLTKCDLWDDATIATVTTLLQKKIKQPLMIISAKQQRGLKELAGKIATLLASTPTVEPQADVVPNDSAT